MSPSPTRPGSASPEAVNHVIAEYRHRDLWVICTCGWQGSSEARGRSPRPGDSDWSDHRAAMRTGPERSRSAAVPREE